MRPRVRAILELVRVPNLLTAVADILAGFLYMGGSLSHVREAMLLAFASVSLYGSGVALNDVCDVEHDRDSRPQRPIPSGRITTTYATRFIASLLLLGVVLAFAVSRLSGVLAICIVAAVILYNAVLKATPLAPLMMGLCRVFNLALGMSFVGSLTLRTANTIPLMSMGLYVASVTFFARTESGSSKPWRLVCGAMGIGLSVAILASLQWVLADPHSSFLVGVILLLLFVGSICRRAVLSGLPQVVQPCVGKLVVGIIVLDGCIAWAGRGLLCTIIVATCLIPTMALMRRFRVS